MRVGLIPFFAIAMLCAAPAFSAPSIDDEVEALEPKLGHYPPDVGSPQELKEITAHYASLKARLDQLVAAHPDDMAVLLSRAHLEEFGHNLDLDGAYAGAERDYLAVIERQPSNQRVMLDLANMWVNTGSEAPRAEYLYRVVQCLNGTVPVEEAQRGLYFAFNYQKKYADELRQSRFLAEHWPDVEIYHRFYQWALGHQPKDAAPMDETQVAMSSCPKQ